MTFETISGVAADVKDYMLENGTLTEAEVRAGVDHYMSFKVDGRIVVYRGKAQIKTGDVVVASGKPAKAEFNALALRNDTTGEIYKAKAFMEIFWFLTSGVLPACLLVWLYLKGFLIAGDLLIADFVMVICYIIYYALNASRVNQLLGK